MGLSLAVVFLVTAAPADALLRRLDAQEATNDSLEKSLDALCSKLKRGEPAKFLAVEGLVHVSGCSMRALSLTEVPPLAHAQLWWEVDGRTATGVRRTVRGAGEATFERRDGQPYALASLDAGTPTVIDRASPRFVVHRWVDETGRVPRDAEVMVGGLSVRDLDADQLSDVLWADGPVVRARWSKSAARADAVVATASGAGIFTSIALGDVDGDGDADAALTSYHGGPVRLLRNDSGQLMPWATVGTDGPHQSALFSDLDGDGVLELAVVSYPLTGRWPSSFLEADNGFALEVFRVAADGRSTRWEFPVGLHRKRWGLAAAAAFVPTVGHALYVANDYGSNDLWHFERDGGVSESAALLGVTDPGNGMSVDFGDVDGDGRLDLSVANMFSKAGTRVLAAVPHGTPQRERLLKFSRGNSLFLGQVDGGYREAAQQLGVARGLWAYGSVFADVDDDGLLEVAVANGFFSRPNRTDY